VDNSLQFLTSFVYVKCNDKKTNWLLKDHPNIFADHVLPLRNYKYKLFQVHLGLLTSIANCAIQTGTRVYCIVLGFVQMIQLLRIH